jgi:hypothetical protein
MSVKWMEVENKIRSIDSVEIPAKNVIETSWERDCHIVNVDAGGDRGFVEFNLSDMFSPVLGNFWRVLYDNEDFDGIRDAILKYWKYKDAPTLKAKMINFEDDTSAVLNTRLTKEKDKEKSKYDPNEVIAGVNASFEYDRCLVGSNNENIELQFLNSGNRINASRVPEVNDFIDPGLFVFMNGNVQISAGCNRLICKNGLTEHLNVFESREYRFDQEILDRAVSLANWLVAKQDNKVESIRELSVILNSYPKPMQSRYWKEWSAKIETGELTWFDVINDITFYANKYMDKTRRKLIQFGETVRHYETDAVCPVCSTHIHE